jgi:hypothetical protein
MKGTCHLCDQNKELRESHVIPSFVYKWIKESSGGGYLRFGMKPNKCVQDGHKYFWLCDDCEGIFSKWEDQFAKNIFHPTVSGKVGKVSYGHWLLKFCVSVSWRVLNLYLIEHDLDHFSNQMQEKAKQTHQVWKEFLLGDRPHPARNEQHFLPLDSIESHAVDKMPTNINRYILRDIDAVTGEKSAFVYSKLERFVIIGFIEISHPRQWEGTKVHVKHGVVGPSNYTLPMQFGDYFMDKARRAADVQAKISEKQNTKIEQTFRKNIDNIANSETFRAMSEDVRLFGKRAFNKSDKDE